MWARSSNAIFCALIHNHQCKQSNIDSNHPKQRYGFNHQSVMCRCGFVLHIEAETRWLSFRISSAISWITNFRWNFTETCCLGSYWQNSSAGSDKSLAPKRQQSIISIKFSTFADAKMRHSGSVSQGQEMMWFGQQWWISLLVFYTHSLVSYAVSNPKYRYYHEIYRLLIS